MDQSLGWHGILGALHQALGWNVEGLMIFSVVALFLVLNGVLLPWLRRPEAWLGALLIAMVISDLPQRWLLGRPFILTTASLMTILFMVQRRAPDVKSFVPCALMIGACTFIHGVWYLWLLPIAAIFFAGQFRWSLLLTGAWLVGTGFSMVASGHPVDYLSHALGMAVHGVGGHLSNRSEVTELQPFGGDILAVVLFGALVVLRLATRHTAPTLTKNPAFWLMCGCWILSFRVGRFWEDWGWPALMVLVVTELDLLFAEKFVADSLRRLWLVLILSVAAFFAVTADLNSRYTKNLDWSYLSVTEHPEIADWMPDADGILYSPDMGIFYQTFYKNPTAKWRYLVGFEPALMPADDFKTYQEIFLQNGDAKAYEPWVKKMKPADRLVLRAGKNERPGIAGLEWDYAVPGIWIGRTPRTSAH